MTRRLTNQDAFDLAMLYLLNQGHRCLSTSGQARYRGPRGKSVIGALIPDDLYATSMEGTKLQHWLAAQGTEYDALRERFKGVKLSLLDDLQALHDRTKACMPNLYRHLVVAGAQRVAQSFNLSMRLVLRCAAYQNARGPQIFVPPGTTRSIPRAAAAPVVEVPPVPNPAPAPAVAAVAAPAPAAPAAPGLAAAPAPVAAPQSAPAPAPVPQSAAPAPQSVPVPQRPEDELDLFARGLAKAIAAATRPASST